jgi:hypothetical protein
VSWPTQACDGSIPIDSYDPNLTQVEPMEPNGNAWANSQIRIGWGAATYYRGRVAG